MGIHKKFSNDYDTKLRDFNSNGGDETQDWIAIKAEIDALSQKNTTGSELLKKSKEISDYWNKVRAQMRKSG